MKFRSKKYIQMLCKLCREVGKEATACAHASALHLRLYYTVIITQKIIMHRINYEVLEKFADANRTWLPVQRDCCPCSDHGGRPPANSVLLGL